MAGPRSNAACQGCRPTVAAVRRAAVHPATDGEVHLAVVRRAMDDPVVAGRRSAGHLVVGPVADRPDAADPDADRGTSAQVGLPGGVDLPAGQPRAVSAIRR
jgi:hypothetical protein